MALVVRMPDGFDGRTSFYGAAASRRFHAAKGHLPPVRVRPQRGECNTVL